jgi:hypothetical protein
MPHGSLARKLGLKPGMRFVVVDGPDEARRALDPLPTGASEAPALRGHLDLILLFARDQRSLIRRWPSVIAALTPDSVLWVAHPKKSSGIESDLAGMDGWEVLTQSDWQPVSLISIDGTWSANRLKHVPGLRERRAARQDERMFDADGTCCIDRAARIVTPPADLQRAWSVKTDAAARAKAAFRNLSFTNQREYVGWILEAKRAETRAQRVASTVDKLASGKKNPSDR